VSVSQVLGQSGRLKCMLALAAPEADQYAILDIQRHRMAQALGMGWAMAWPVVIIVMSGNEGLWGGLWAVGGARAGGCMLSEAHLRRKCRGLLLGHHRHPGSQVFSLRT
jgi:hypothetical protein